MGVWVMVSVAVIMSMIVVMAVPVIVGLIGTACINALDMMVVAFLHQTHLILEAEHLFAILAQLAIHRVAAAQNLQRPFGKGVQHKRVIVQVSRFDEFDVRVPCGDLVHIAVYAFHQNAGEQKIRKHDDPLETQPRGMFKPRFDQGKGNAGIHGLRPAKAQPFPQHAGYLGNIGIGVRIGRAATNNHQQRLFSRDRSSSRIQGFHNATAGGIDHLWIDAKFAAIQDFNAVILGLIGIQYRGNVVFGMAGGEQHARDGKDTLVAACAQRIQPGTNNRRGKFQKAVINIVIRQAAAQPFGNRLEFMHRGFVAAAMAAYDNASFLRHFSSSAAFLENGPYRISPGRAGQAKSRYNWRMISIPETIARSADPLVVLAIALILDLVVADMRWLFRAVPHPVVVFGRLIGFLDGKLNRSGRSAANRLIRGVVVVVIVAGLAGVTGWALSEAARRIPYGWGLGLFFVVVLIAQRSLFDHGRAVARALRRDGLAAGRAAVAHIVGRQTDKLDEYGVARGAIESLAENFADGVVAPAFWYVLLGLPGLFAYKAINTMDSMIGYKSDRYRDFGMAAARLDDVVNLIPARLSGIFFILAAVIAPTANPARALRVMWRDAGKHDSPNAGWPEAAVAGALNLSLGGPRQYLGGVSKAAWLGDGNPRATARDINRTLMLYAVAGLLHFLFYVLLAAMWLT